MAAYFFAKSRKFLSAKVTKGTVAEDYQGILVHDHDITFYNYGKDHQECLAHVLRYLNAASKMNQIEPGTKRCTH